MRYWPPWTAGRGPVPPVPAKWLGAVLLCLALPGWWIDRTAFLAAWLAGWLLCAGVVMGGLANVWLHTLTGGRWGESIRARLVEQGRLVPWLALLFVPVLAGMTALYPWAGAEHWSGGVGFKRAWLQPAFFVVRAAVVLGLWWALARATRRPRLARPRAFAAFALVAYGLTVSVAAADWIMSLMPRWYSASFGLLVGMGQILAGTAFAVVTLAHRPARADRQVMRDLGNLLLAYLMLWAYVAFTQYLIVWSENLPEEIAWYVVRLHTRWWWAGLALIVFHFLVPFLVLLFRRAKESPRLLGTLAAGLLAMQLVDLWWLVLPSVADRADGRHWLWLAPLLGAGLPCLAWGLLPRERAAQRASPAPEPAHPPTFQQARTMTAQDPDREAPEHGGSRGRVECSWRGRGLSERAERASSAARRANTPPGPGGSAARPPGPPESPAPSLTSLEPAGPFSPPSTALSRAAQERSAGGADDVPARRIAAAAGTVLIAVLLVGVAGRGLLALWGIPATTGAGAPLDFAPAPPVLLSAPQDERRAYFAAKRRELERYRWIDRDAGIAQIPIEEAMAILAGQADAQQGRAR